MATFTPWGPSQQSKRIARGITRYATARHGGIKLSNNRFIEMPTCLRRLEPWVGHPWYEEDLDWAIPVLAYPEHFTTHDCYHAVKTAEWQINRERWALNLDDPCFADVKAKAALHEQ